MRFLAATIAALAFHHPAHHLHRRQYPAWWVRASNCIHDHESTNWHIRNYPYGGGFQFLDQTWWAHAPRGFARKGITAWTATPAEQRFVAWRTWIYDGRSWREWSTRKVCGLA